MVTRSGLKAISSVDTDVDSLEEAYRVAKVERNADAYRYGGPSTFSVYDNARNSIRMVIERGAKEVVLTPEWAIFPGSLSVAGSVEVRPNVILNPNGLVPSTIISPTPAYVTLPSPTGGLFAALSGFFRGML